MVLSNNCRLSVCLVAYLVIFFHKTFFIGFKGGVIASVCVFVVFSGSSFEVFEFVSKCVVVLIRYFRVIKHYGGNYANIP